MTALYNANTRSAYQAGYYLGSFSIGTILRHGDTGLGACDGNDGELVIDRGKAWRSDVHGVNHELNDDDTSPFATVVAWQSADRFTVDQPMNRAEFDAAIGARLPLDNRIWALRVSGQFDRVTAGASARQHAPTRPLEEVMAEYSRHTWTDTAGSLIGFYGPPFLKGVDYVGFHYHWLSDDHQHGGHVFDYAPRSVVVEAQEVSSYTTELPASEDFYRLDLAPFH
jgi:acetolactate decarboxylase